MPEGPPPRRARRSGPAPPGDIERAICDAAERLLAAERLADLSVAQILSAAHVSRASFYFYFPSKQAVLARLAEGVVDEVYAATQTWLHRADGQPPHAALEAAMRSALGLWRRHDAVMRAIVETWHTSAEIGDVWERLIGRFTDAAAEQIERERTAGVAPAGGQRAHTLAATLVWMTERSLYVAISSGEPDFADDDALVATLADVWWRAIYALAPAA
jgi:AcrR family transcriptional regulator